MPLLCLVLCQMMGKMHGFAFYLPSSQGDEAGPWKHLKIAHGQYNKPEQVWPRIMGQAVFHSMLCTRVIAQTAWKIEQALRQSRAMIASPCSAHQAGPQAASDQLRYHRTLGGSESRDSASNHHDSESEMPEVPLPGFLLPHSGSVFPNKRSIQYSR